MAAIRIMAGGHFPSDIIFAGVFTFLIVWLAYAVIYRWRTRLDDKQIESGLERISIVRWLTAR
jgi:membrane-associated phospholipid phosphatase